MLRNLKQCFARHCESPFLRNAAILGSGSAVVHVIALALVPLLTRLYTPEAFGALGIFLTLLTILLSLSSFHYEMAIAMPSSSRQAGGVVAVCLLVAAAVTIASVMLFAPGGADLLHNLAFPELASYWWLLPVALGASAIRQVFVHWHLRCNRYKPLALNSISQSLVQGGAQVLFGLLAWKSFGLILGLTISRITAALGLILLALKNDRSSFQGGAGLLASAKEFRSFPLVGLPGALLHSACFQLPALLLASAFGMAVAGFYTLQERVLSVPLTLVGQSVAGVFYVNAARLAQEDRTRLKQLYLKLLRNLCFAGLPPTLILMAFGPSLFTFVFGPAWESAGQFAQIMAVPMFVRFVAGPLFRCLTIFKEQIWILIWDALGCLILLLMPLVISGADSSNSGVVYIALAVSLVYGGLLLSATLVVFGKGKQRSSQAQVRTATFVPGP